MDFRKCLSEELQEKLMGYLCTDRFYPFLPGLLHWKWGNHRIWFANGPNTRYVKLRVVHASKCRERFPRKLLDCDPGMHHGTCVTRHARAVMHIAIANPRWWEKVPSIPGACSTHNFAYLAKGPCHGSNPEEYEDIYDTIPCTTVVI